MTVAPARIAFTGHRPDKIGGYDLAADQLRVAFARRVLRGLQARYAPECFITGMAQGWDIAVAEACRQIELPYIAAVPFPEQTETWPRAARRRWDRLCAAAAEVHVLEPSFSIAGLHRRNEWMVNRAGLLVALWDGSSGGTAACMRYAAKVGTATINVWPLWQTHLGRWTSSASTLDDVGAPPGPLPAPRIVELKAAA
jgi:uncharacterized phage-like protein YoqJ